MSRVETGKGRRKVRAGEAASRVVVQFHHGMLLGYGGLELGDVVRGAWILAQVIEYAASNKVVHAG
jgi:hypothetical protein